MGDVLQTNVVAFIQTLHKAVSELSEKTGSMLKNIDGTGYAAEQKGNDDKFKERGESKKLTTQEKERYKEIFGIFNQTTKFASLITKFDKGIANFLKLTSKQSTENQKTTTLLQKKLELFTKSKTQTQTTQVSVHIAAPKPIRAPKKEVPDNAAIENINKNVSIIANVMNKQYLADQKKFDVTTKFSSTIKNFDKGIANFLKLTSKQSTENQKTTTLLQKKLKLFTKSKTQTQTQTTQVLVHIAAPKPIRAPKKEVPDNAAIENISKNVSIIANVMNKQYDNAAIENISKNVSIIANVMNKQYLADQKKFDTLKRDENIPNITPKTVPLSEKNTSKVSSLKDTVLSFLGNTLKLLIGGLIGYWILKNPQKAIKILKDAWEFIKMLGGKLWDLAKFLWPIIKETGNAIWESIKFIAPYVMKFINLVGKVVEWMGPKLTGAIAAILIGYKLFGGKITSLIFEMTRGIFKGIGSLTTYIGKKLFSKVATKAAGKVATKAAGRSLLKKIPLVGAVAGLAFGVGRLFSGDWKGAAAEVASGVASTIPGVGTAVSLAVDAGLAARDINNETKEAAKMTKEAAGAAAGAAGAAEDAAESVEDAAGVVKDKAKQPNIPGKETSIPDFDNDISPAYKEITDKLIDGNKNQLSVSKLQLDQITTNGTKLDKIIECLKNPQLNTVTVNQKSSNNSTLQTNIVPQKSLTKAEYVDSLNLFGQNLREGVV